MEKETDFREEEMKGGRAQSKRPLGQEAHGAGAGAAAGCPALRPADASSHWG